MTLRFVRYAGLAVAGFGLALAFLVTAAAPLHANNPLERDLARAEAQQAPILVFVDRQRRRFPPPVRPLTPYLQHNRIRDTIVRIGEADVLYRQVERLFLKAQLEPGVAAHDAVLNSYDCRDFPALLFLNYKGEKIGLISVGDIDAALKRRFENENIRDHDMYLLYDRLGRRLLPFLQSNRMAIAEELIVQKKYDDAKKVFDELQKIDPVSTVADAAKQRIRWIDNVPARLLEEAADHANHARVGQAMASLREIAEGFSWNHPSAREARLRLAALQGSSLYRNWAALWREAGQHRLEFAATALEQGAYETAIDAFAALVRERFDDELASQAETRLREAVLKALEKAESDLTSGNREQAASLCQSVLRQSGLVRPVDLGRARTLLQRAEGEAP